MTTTSIIQNLAAISVGDNTGFKTVVSISICLSIIELNNFKGIYVLVLHFMLLLLLVLHDSMYGGISICWHGHLFK